jgi:hypothetical protein
LQKQHVTAIAKKGKSAIAKKLVQKSFMPWHCQIATMLVFAWCGCNLVKIQVIATSFAVWLHPLMCCDCEKKVAKTTMCMIATLSQCDCTLIAVWLQKNSCKNSMWLRLQKQHVTVIAKKR